MDFRWSAEDEAFRTEVRSWLKDHLVGEYAALGSGGGPADETGWDVRLALKRVSPTRPRRFLDFFLALTPVTVQKPRWSCRRRSSWWRQWWS